MSRILHFHQHMNAEAFEELRARFRRQAEYPSVVAENIGALRQALSDPETDRSAVLRYLDAMSANSVAAHENSRWIWDVMRKAKIFDPDGKKGRRLQ